jgi:hypothetical protein
LAIVCATAVVVEVAVGVGETVVVGVGLGLVVAVTVAVGDGVTSVPPGVLPKAEPPPSRTVVATIPVNACIRRMCAPKAPESVSHY